MLPVGMFYKFACTMAVIGHTLALEIFECHGTLCNWKGEEQFCQAAYPYCRNCNDITDDCLTFTAPKNCSNTCHEFLKTKALQEQSSIKCPDLPNLQSGSYNEEGPFKHGQVAVATCDPGFTLTGDRSLFCFDGEWNVSPPVCTNIKCPDLPSLQNGSYNEEGPFKHGQVAVATCDPGFTFTGDRSLFCFDGEWNVSPPVCTNIKCPDLPSLQNGSYNEEGPFKHGQVAVATCDPGFTFIGDRSLFCFDGEWNVSPPVCTRVICDDPPALMDGKWFIDDPAQNIYVEMTAHFQCNAKFDLVGPKQWQCSLKGTWEPVPNGLGTTFPVCQKNQMNKDIVHAVVSVSCVLTAFIVVLLVWVCRLRQKTLKTIAVYSTLKDVESGNGNVENGDVQYDKKYDNIDETTELLDKEKKDETFLVKSEDVTSELGDDSNHQGSEKTKKVSVDSQKGEIIHIDVNLASNQTVNVNGDTATKYGKPSNQDNDKDEDHITLPVHHDPFPTQATEQSEGCEPSAPDISLLNDSDNENDSSTVIYNEINDITRNNDREAEDQQEPVATISPDNANSPTANFPFEVERDRDKSVNDQRRNPISQETEQQSSISKAKVFIGNSSIPAVDLYKR